MTAEDVLPENTGQIGLPDKANPGWDPHFGYGRVNLAAAMARIEAGSRPAGWPCGPAHCIPPEAQIDAPDWFAPIDVDRVPAAASPIKGRAAAPHSAAGVGDWELEYACGQDALDSDFQPIPGASGTGPVDGVARHAPEGAAGRPRRQLRRQVAERRRPPGRRGADGAWPADPYPDPDPERHAFQIRLTVHEAGDPANFGRYRKTLFAYHDDGNLAGWPRPVGTGSAPRAGHRLRRRGLAAPLRPRRRQRARRAPADLQRRAYALHADGTPVRASTAASP